MEHHFSLITTIASGFAIALVFGFLAERLKLPALVGYLLAGILIGPGTPGFVADIHIASQLSEIGVMLLMFGVGLHFSLRDLLAVKRIAIPGAVLQMSIATGLGCAVALWWGWSWGAAFVFGVSLSCASTVVLLKALEARNILDTMNGKIAVGWLVVEDLATVFILVLLPPLAGILGGKSLSPTGSDTAIWLTIGQTLLQVFAFIAVMLVAGRRVMPWLLWQVARTGSRELFTLAVITAAISIAYGAAKLFSVSFALGAFFAGMVMRESEFSHRAAQESLPLRDAFSVLFFVSVGMLFDPAILMTQPLQVLATVFIIMVGKTIAALILVLVFCYPFNTALTVAVSLAQIGEFSFILAGLGLSLGLLPQTGMSLILAGALISIALNPVLFAAIKPFRDWLLDRFQWARKMEARRDPYAELPTSTQHQYLAGQVVLVGYGRVGSRIAEVLTQRGIPFVVAEQNREIVETLREQGIAAVSGDVTDPAVLIQAHIANAAMLVAACPDPMIIRQMIQTAKTLNPQIEVVLRSHSEEESQLFQEEGNIVFFAEEQLANGIAKHVVARFAPKTGRH